METGSDPLVVAAAASVVLSWYQYYVRGNREAGLFVGLWAPTLLSFASYYRQRQMLSQQNWVVRQLEKLSPSGIRESVEKMVRGE